MAGTRDEKAFVRWPCAGTVADGVSVMGRSISTAVRPLVVDETTGSAATTGALFALRIIPYVLFGAVAGPLADRKTCRRLIVGGHRIEGVLGPTILPLHSWAC